MRFFGRLFFFGGFFAAIGGGHRPVLSWKDHVENTYRQRVLERQLRRSSTELKTVERKIEIAQKKASKKSPQSVPQGILANLWKLEQRREQVKSEIADLRMKWDEVAIILAMAANQMEEEENEIEMILLA